MKRGSGENAEFGEEQLSLRSRRLSVLKSTANRIVMRMAAKGLEGQ